MRASGIRVQLDVAPVAALSLVEPAESREQQAAVVQRIFVPGNLAQRGVVTRERIVEPAEILQRDGAGVSRVRIRRKRERTLERLECVRRVAELMPAGADQEPRPRVGRVRGDMRFEQRQRRLRLAGAQLLERRVERQLSLLAAAPARRCS